MFSQLREARLKREPAELAALSKLLEAGLDIEPGARATWIEGLSPDVDALKPTLRKLLLTLAAQETADVIGLGQHVQAAVAAGFAESRDLKAGSTIGPYELIRELGRASCRERVSKQV